jgi:hypothetical protein
MPENKREDDAQWAKVIAKRAARVEVAERVIREHEVSPGDDIHDGSIPGAGEVGDRFLLVQESGRGFGRSITYCGTRPGVAQVAAENLDEQWTPVCFYDLDELAGSDPGPCEGDKVMHDGERDWYVVAAELEVSDGEPLWKYHLNKDPELYLDDDGTIVVDEDHIMLVERAEPDMRLPARYDVAGTIVQVFFNTVPSP